MDKDTDDIYTKINELKKNILHNQRQVSCHEQADMNPMCSA